MGGVVEWARRWLGVSQLQAENRLLRSDLRRVELALEQLQANVADAEKVAVRAPFSADGDTLARVIGILRRGAK